MNIFINEKKIEVEDNITLYSLKNKVKKDADIIIYNSFIVKEDIKIKENDKIVFIKRGEIPSRQDMEAQLLARHTPGVHEKIKTSFIGIAGLGGLGSNIAIALGRIGVGKLLLVDYDVVEPSNLNRQHYFIKHIGMKKTQALKEIIAQCNPYVQVITKDKYIDETNTVDIFKDVDLIIEAVDNPKCKAALTNTVLTKMKNKKIIAASGVAGYFENNTIVTRKINDNFYIVGDEKSEAAIGMGLMAPRVGIAANHQANLALRIILGEE
ncbi:sulfur carrier protein ThiS adenylyltransferase ThiF [Clostridium tetanomorphum]|uniref:Sulfur carrier protein ThiS adenylyltransferase ThiF n=1 Tax=Clostridium tetanomorphum TaxID=1553 RepID=A0A923E8K9_CLOTT|nr:sulfur carrier protein ThiS adenylyltransferase ThiF [Clostridium tetanomorphum]MBC2398458.1 sulfur carrier protein ThiS adenylyltransferase ThiF [Clostridium tetanomorphum]NRZ98403.1 sulfur carrier protein ThiS adenylyltransferase [Clostridium tetanomorphum]